MRRRARDRQRAEQAGRLAELAGAWLLRVKGYHIVAKRVRPRRGEIDLVAVRGNIVACIEVKHRSLPDDAVQAVTDQAWRRIASAAQIWMAGQPSLAKKDWRYDLITVTPRRLPQHLTDFWRP